MKRNHWGASLQEYAIIVGVLSLALVPSCIVLKDQIANAFSQYTNNYTDMNNKIAGNMDLVARNTKIDTSTNSDSTDTNTNNSKVSCSNNTCTVDFGDFALSGVPQDLNKIVETAGVSGGMESLVGMLDQIAQQYESQGKTEEAKDIKILATTGHNMAAIQKSFEDYVYNVCKGDETCLKDHVNQIFPKPVGFNETYQKFPTNVTYYDAPYLTNIGVGVIPDDYPEDSIAVFYNETLRKIKNNDNITDSTKGIIQELTWDIGTISQKWLPSFAYLTTSNFIGDNYYMSYEPLTGDEKQNYYANNATFSNVYAGINESLKAPELTNIDAGLICATGSYTDTGTSCH